MADLPGHLRSLGFDVVLAEEDIARDAELLAGAVRRLVDRPAG